MTTRPLDYRSLAHPLISQPSLPPSLPPSLSTHRRTWWTGARPFPPTWGSLPTLIIPNHHPLTLPLSLSLPPSPPPSPQEDLVDWCKALSSYLGEPANPGDFQATHGIDIDTLRWSRHGGGREGGREGREGREAPYQITGQFHSHNCLSFPPSPPSLQATVVS